MFAGPNGSGRPYLSYLKVLLRCACFLNVSTVFLRKSSNSIFNEAPVCRGILCSEWILLLPCQDGKITNQRSLQRTQLFTTTSNGTFESSPVPERLTDFIPMLRDQLATGLRTRGTPLSTPQTCTCLNKSKGISTIVILIILEFPAGIQPYLKNEVRKFYPRVGRKITAAVVLLTAHIAV